MAGHGDSDAAMASQRHRRLFELLTQAELQRRRATVPPASPPPRPQSLDDVSRMALLSLGFAPEPHPRRLFGPR